MQIVVGETEVEIADVDGRLGRNKAAAASAVAGSMSARRRSRRGMTGKVVVVVAAAEALRLGIGRGHGGDRSEKKEVQVEVEVKKRATHTHPHRRLAKPQQEISLLYSTVQYSTMGKLLVRRSETLLYTRCAPKHHVLAKIQKTMAEAFVHL